MRQKFFSTISVDVSLSGIFEERVNKFKKEDIQRLGTLSFKTFRDKLNRKRIDHYLQGIG